MAGADSQIRESAPDLPPGAALRLTLPLTEREVNQAEGSEGAELGTDLRILETLGTDLSEDGSVEALWDLMDPLPPLPETEGKMELRVKLTPLAQRRLNLLETLGRPVFDWAFACTAWLQLRDSFRLCPSDYVDVRVYEKGNPVAQLSWGGAVWTYVDQELPFMEECRCLYDPRGINT